MMMALSGMILMQAKKAIANCKQKQTQFQHEAKKREREQGKLKEQLQKVCRLSRQQQRQSTATSAHPVF